MVDDTGYDRGVVDDTGYDTGFGEWLMILRPSQVVDNTAFAFSVQRLEFLVQGVGRWVEFNV